MPNFPSRQGSIIHELFFWPLLSTFAQNSPPCFSNVESYSTKILCYTYPADVPGDAAVANSIILHWHSTFLGLWYTQPPPLELPWFGFVTRMHRKIIFQQQHAALPLVLPLRITALLQGKAKPPSIVTLGAYKVLFFLWGRKERRIKNKETSTETRDALIKFSSKTQCHVYLDFLAIICKGGSLFTIRFWWARTSAAGWNNRIPDITKQGPNPGSTNDKPCHQPYNLVHKN